MQHRLKIPNFSHFYFFWYPREDIQNLYETSTDINIKVSINQGNKHITY